MRLSIDFSSLHSAVRRMGAEHIEVDLTRPAPAAPLDPIDIQLQEGLELDLSNVSVAGGLLSYEGRQVLLYIQDQGRNIDEAIEHGSNGRKVHVADCQTLSGMRERGRFERFVATNDLSEDFYVTGVRWPSGEVVEGTANLRVCRHCLTKLNYKGYRSNRSAVFAGFSIEAFFSTYSSFFPHMPKRKAGKQDAGYTDDWSQVSAAVKAAANFRCDACKLDLTRHSRLLHVHHRNGVKIDNTRANLLPLCADCHRKQVSHEHMFVSHDDMRLISRLRSEQQMTASNWDNVFELADPAVHGLLHILRGRREARPEVGYELQDASGKVVAEMEIAWPSRRRGYAISPGDAEQATKLGWTVLDIEGTLDQ
jgi:hypothetical protein